MKFGNIKIDDIEYCSRYSLFVKERKVEGCTNLKERQIDIFNDGTVCIQFYNKDKSRPAPGRVCVNLLFSYIN